MALRCNRALRGSLRAAPRPAPPLSPGPRNSTEAAARAPLVTGLAPTVLAVEGTAHAVGCPTGSATSVTGPRISTEAAAGAPLVMGLAAAVVATERSVTRCVLLHVFFCCGCRRMLHAKSHEEIRTCELIILELASASLHHSYGCTLFEFCMLPCCTAPGPPPWGEPFGVLLSLNSN